MFNLRALAITLALTASCALGQRIPHWKTKKILIIVVNPITRPTVGDILVAGGTFDILVFPTRTLIPD